VDVVFSWSVSNWIGAGIYGGRQYEEVKADKLSD
jgi:hypothetical protein